MNWETRASATLRTSVGLCEGVKSNSAGVRLIALDDVVSEINSTMASASGQRAVAVTGDVSKEEDVKAMVESVAHQLGGLDVVRPVRFRFHADSSSRGSSYVLDGRQRRDPPFRTADRP